MPCFFPKRSFLWAEVYLSYLKKWNILLAYVKKAKAHYHLQLVHFIITLQLCLVSPTVQSDSFPVISICDSILKQHHCADYLQRYSRTSLCSVSAIVLSDNIPVLSICNTILNICNSILEQHSQYLQCYSRIASLCSVSAIVLSTNIPVLPICNSILGQHICAQ